MTSGVNQVHITHMTPSLWLSSSICCVSYAAWAIESYWELCISTRCPRKASTERKARDVQVQRAFCKAKSKAKLGKWFHWQVMIVPPQLWHAEILAKSLLLFIGLSFFHLLSYLSLSHSYTRSIFLFFFPPACVCQNVNFRATGCDKACCPGGRLGIEGLTNWFWFYSKSFRVFSSNGSWSESGPEYGTGAGD